MAWQHILRAPDTHLNMLAASTRMPSLINAGGPSWRRQREESYRDLVWILNRYSVATWQRFRQVLWVVASTVGKQFSNPILEIIIIYSVAVFDHGNCEAVLFERPPIKSCRDLIFLAIRTAGRYPMSRVCSGGLHPYLASSLPRIQQRAPGIGHTEPQRSAWESEIRADMEERRQRCESPALRALRERHGNTQSFSSLAKKLQPSFRFTGGRVGRPSYDNRYNSQGKPSYSAVAASPRTDPQPRTTSTSQASLPRGYQPNTSRQQRDSRNRGRRNDQRHGRVP